MQYWLFKSEPSEFSIDDLRACPNGEDSWDGVRNYQARNFMRDSMKVGDLALFYHSNCKQIGIVGVVEISKESHPDHKAWDKDDKHYDPKSPPEKPIWYMVAVKYKKRFKRVIPLAEVKEHPILRNMRIAQKGNRLSITPVTQQEFETIVQLGE